MATPSKPITDGIEDIPGYREAGVSVCANCLYVLKSDDEGDDLFYCTAYDAVVEPGWVCDSWKPESEEMEDEADGYKEKDAIALDVTDFPRQGDDQTISLRNSNYPQFDYEYAQALKEEYPSIWRKGGNIRGNTAFVLWGRARDGETTEGVQDWIREREAWAARHEGDFRIAGVVACVKWGVIVSRGESYMKDLINEEKRKVDERDSLTRTIDLIPDNSVQSGLPALSMGRPTAQDMALINGNKPVGMDDLSSEEIYVLPVLASHNLMSHSKGVWDAESLIAMAQEFPGKPLIIDHDWDSVESTVGFVYDADLVEVESDRTPAKVLRAFEDVNRLILSREQRFIGLILKLALDKAHPMVNAIKYRRVNDVSTGGLTNGVFWCPICDTSLEDAACPHIIDYGYSADEKRYIMEQGLQFTPYYIRKGFQTAIELSFVIAGNLPGAGLIGESMLGEMLGQDRTLRMRIGDRSKSIAQKLVGSPQSERSR